MSSDLAALRSSLKTLRRQIEGDTSAKGRQAAAALQHLDTCLGSMAQVTPSTPGAHAQALWVEAIHAWSKTRTAAKEAGNVWAL
jgi:hypothetical protein